MAKMNEAALQLLLRQVLITGPVFSLQSSTKVL